MTRVTTDFVPVVGARCHRDVRSLCGPDQQAFGSWCYKLTSRDPITRDRAQFLCENDGGKLLHIHSQAENEFVSEWMASISPNIKRVHTGGAAVKGPKRTLFFWEHDEQPMNFTKWWPGKFSKILKWIFLKVLPFWQDGIRTLPAIRF